MWAGSEARTEPRKRSGPAGRKPGERGRGSGCWALCSGWPVRPVWFLGMVSKGLLRLFSSVNRRKMKLLLGIALLAYAACECECRGREPIHSRAAGSGC